MILVLDIWGHQSSLSKQMYSVNALVPLWGALLLRNVKDLQSNTALPYQHTNGIKYGGWRGNGDKRETDMVPYLPDPAPHGGY